MKKKTHTDYILVRKNQILIEAVRTSFEYKQINPS